MVSLVAILACGVTITLIYLESLWWLLAMPVCLTRVVENLKVGAGSEPKPPGPEGAAKSLPPRRPGRRSSRKKSDSVPQV